MPRRLQHGVPGTVADATVGALAHTWCRRERKRGAENRDTDLDGARAPGYQVTPGRQHKREPLDDDGLRLVGATASIKVVSRQMPTSSLTGPLHFYPSGSDLSSGEREKDEDEIVGTGSTNVPSAVVVAPIVSEHKETGRDLGGKGTGNGRRNGPCNHFLDGKCQRGVKWVQVLSPRGKRMHYKVEA
jgi:hypothetical protein